MISSMLPIRGKGVGQIMSMKAPPRMPGVERLMDVKPDVPFKISRDFATVSEDKAERSTLTLSSHAEL